MTTAIQNSRPILIIGKDASGRVAAEDRTDSHWKAQQIADGWRGSGMEVEVIDHQDGHQ